MRNIKEETVKKRALNLGQLNVLKQLYLFRFLTAGKLAALEKQRSSVVTNARLSRLYAQGYIGRHYDKSYKLRGKPAAYYLLPAGMATLKTAIQSKKIVHLFLHQRTLKAIYNDKTASLEFIDTSLAIIDLSLCFQELYGDSLLSFTRSNLVRYDYFPAQLPDLYFNVKREPLEQSFVDYYGPHIKLFVMVNKFRRYIDYAESGEWEQTDTEFPTLRIVCATAPMEALLRKRLRSLLRASLSDITICTTTLDELRQASSMKNLFRDI